jgi:hypothetical protein
MYINPMFAVDTDIWSMRDAPKRAAIISIIAPQRSILEALLKKAHHIKTASPRRTPPKIAIPIAPGARAGKPNLNSHCSITITTPGHNRSLFLTEDSSGLLFVSIIFIYKLK